MVEFKVRRASTWNYEEPLKITTLEELLEFAKKEGDIVVEENHDEYSILIYDDYIE